MRVKSISAAVLFTALLVMIAGCDLGLGDSDEGEPPVTYAIGDTGPSGVGIVFYVTDGGLHGLEVSPVDQSISAAWSSINNALVNGATALPDGIGTGSSNTDAIISQNAGGPSAAKIAREYAGGGKTDWFLPSKNELWEIWWNLVSDQSADNDGRGSPYSGSLGGFSGDTYWSSTESDANIAWGQAFFNGGQIADVKSFTGDVRAVRAF